MSIETFVVTPKADQKIDTVYAVAKNLMIRRVAAGVDKQGGKVTVYLWPKSAAKYAEKKSIPLAVEAYEQDKKAVLDTLTAAGYTIDGAEKPVEAPKPVEVKPKPAPAVKAA